MLPVRQLEPFYRLMVAMVQNGELRETRHLLSTQINYQWFSSLVGLKIGSNISGNRSNVNLAVYAFGEHLTMTTAGREGQRDRLVRNILPTLPSTTLYIDQFCLCKLLSSGEIAEINLSVDLDSRILGNHVWRAVS